MGRFTAVLIILIHLFLGIANGQGLDNFYSVKNKTHSDSILRLAITPRKSIQFVKYLDYDSSKMKTRVVFVESDSQLKVISCDTLLYPEKLKPTFFEILADKYILMTDADSYTGWVYDLRRKAWRLHPIRLPYKLESSSIILQEETVLQIQYKPDAKTYFEFSLLTETGIQQPIKPTAGMLIGFYADKSTTRLIFNAKGAWIKLHSSRKDSIFIKGLQPGHWQYKVLYEPSVIPIGILKDSLILLADMKLIRVPIGLLDNPYQSPYVCNFRTCSNYQLGYSQLLKGRKAKHYIKNLVTKSPYIMTLDVFESELVMWPAPIVYIDAVGYMYANQSQLISYDGSSLLKKIIKLDRLTKKNNIIEIWELGKHQLLVNVEISKYQKTKSGFYIKNWHELQVVEY